MPSQMPDPSPRACSTSTPGFHPFHSPMTQTALAAGAHTANSAPPPARRWQPSLVYSAACEPSRNKRISSSVNMEEPSVSAARRGRTSSGVMDMLSEHFRRDERDALRGHMKALAILL